jgi:site-specific recombinase XerD
MPEENKLQKSESTAKDKYRSIIEMVIDALPSENSRRAYGRHLEEFFDWHQKQGQPELNKALINSYLKSLREDRKLSSANINQKLSAIRKLASEAEDNNLLEFRLANGIRAIKGVTHTKNRLGNWLTQEEAQIWINTPDIKTLKGLRDRALLAVMLGCGLRRSETAILSFSHLQMRQNRWMIVNLVGKRDKMRSIPMAGWIKKGIVEWGNSANLSSGRIFRKVHKSNKAFGESISPQAIYKIIREYADKLDKEKRIAPHDLRRTFAHLSYDGGSEIDQVQLSLGHSSIQTTENYLGIKQKLKDAPSDLIGLKLE